LCKDALPALDLHREVYGHADTPLREVERKRWGHTETVGVFEELPLEFAPLTLTEARKFYTEAKVATVTGPKSAVEDDAPFPKDTDRHGDQDDELFDLLGGLPAGDPTVNEHLYEVSSPDLLDRIRDELLAAQTGGTTFTLWQDLIYHLHIALGIDAGALDLQLSTHEGRTVLTQAGFFNFPPEEFDMTTFLDAPPPIHAL